MKKIAIITWMFSNYGTALQSLALNSFLRSHGFDVYLINYKLQEVNCSKIQPYTPHIILSKIKRKIRSINEKKRISRLCKCDGRMFEERNEKFRAFYKAIPKVPDDPIKKKDLPSLECRFDYFICGSDQIWNPRFFDESYYLSFIADSSKKISYAASMGVMHLRKKEVQRVIPLVKKIKHVSVREISAKRDLIRYDINAKLVADPTLLLSRDQWLNLIHQTDKNKSSSNNTLLIYFLSNNGWYKKVIKNIQSILGKHYTVAFPYTSLAYDASLIDERLAAAGPNEFVNSISQSDLFITDSYHGLCMALIFHINFVVLARFSETSSESENSRILSLLEMTGLTSKMIYRHTIASIDITEPEWKRVDKAVNGLVSESTDFLLGILGEK